ncbi:MAG: SPOR domain-containing protein [Treponema sp.]|nr:SPOR domain-containing protein [Treponema sp.]
MRKLFIICLITAFFTLQGSSPWEGAAAVAPVGELPEDGYYVATNSFPRNTVVDITNIESGKSTRAIVSNTINSPGLLAIVSRQAADLIGMKEGSISRIRMVQPSDPIAYMRFTETMSSDIPEYDSGNVITEENITEEVLLAEVYEDDTYVPSEPEIETVEAPPSSTAGLGYVVDEPEWGGTGRLQIVDLPGYEVVPLEPFPEYSSSVTEAVPEKEEEPAYIGKIEAEEDTPTEPAEIVKIPEPAKEEPVLVANNDIKKEFVKDVSEKINERSPVYNEKDVPLFFPERTMEELEKDTPVYYAEKPRNEVIKDVSPWQNNEERVATPEPLPEEPVAEKTPVQQVLVPVETTPNPPPSVYGIDPNDIIPGIVRAVPERPSAAQPPAPVTPPITSAVLPSQNFSVTTINHLDRGRYYVQVAALSADHVEPAIRAIDRNYKPVVYMNGDNMYRILIGPLNQGESAAILARFRSIGYRDAFVRRGS